MNFFESQDRVRKHTSWLVALFVLAVMFLIGMTNLLVMLVFGFIDNNQVREGASLFGSMDWKTFGVVSAAVGVVVLAGSVYKIMALSGGGKVVAESLGGRLIPSNTQEAGQRKLLNIVEEMAIASGTPAPPVYLLDQESGINAFAAGFSPRDAVLGVTQGAIDNLSREQLQGVIAHEFSHIFNGDMRLNIRLMGVLHGILILGMLGYYLLYSTSLSGRRRGNDKGGIAILALAIGLMVIGFAGTFFGGLIKAAVSRQREYFADASAVQFTRNPDGIAGALKKIGGLQYGSRVENPGASAISHAFFAQGLTGFTSWISATHPPLKKRILRIDPGWDGNFEVPVAAGMAPMTDIGRPKHKSMDYAQLLLAELPAAIKESAREPYGARAVIYCMVLDKGLKMRELQLARLQTHADPDVYRLTRALMPQIDHLDIKFRLPVIDVAIPALKQLSPGQYQAFRSNLMALIEMDTRVDLMEWSLQKIVLRHVDGHFFKPVTMTAHYSDWNGLKREAALLLSVLAHAGAQSQRDASQSFGASVRVLGLGELSLLSKEKIAVVDLDLALQKLDKLRPLDKSQLLKACVISMWHDQQATVAERELLRAFSSVLDCPMPTAAP
jgi:Zn-dependent protease with chaperone function